MTADSNSKRAFNDLLPKEWTRLSRSVWTSREISSARGKQHLEHGATYSVALAERAIRMYSRPGDLVLDPFLGVGTTLVAAARLARRGIGIELYDRFAQMATHALNHEENFKEDEQRVVCADCRELAKWVQPQSVQMVLTSPPYADFIQRSVRDRQRTHKKSRLVIDNRSSVKPYGVDERDFGNLRYEEFLSEIRELMVELLTVTRPGGYNLWVVKDCRDTEHGAPFVDVHSDIGRLGREVGFLYHDLIVWDQNEQRSLVLLGYPSVFYVNINHTFLVILRRPLQKQT